MKGNISEFNDLTGEGLISGDDWEKYVFTLDNLEEGTIPTIDTRVEFEGSRDNQAINIFSCPEPKAITSFRSFYKEQQEKNLWLIVGLPVLIVVTIFIAVSQDNQQTSVSKTSSPSSNSPSQVEAKTPIPTPTPEPTRTPEPPSERKPVTQQTISDEYFGTCTQEAGSRLTKIAVSGDDEAFKNYLTELAYQDCLVLFEVGDTVFIEGAHRLGLTAEIRKQGETRTWFVPGRILSSN